MRIARKLFGVCCTLAVCWAPSAGRAVSFDMFERLVLDAHNHERAKLGVPALVWNDELAEGAQTWARHLADTGRFEHSPNIKGQPVLGENIWGGTARAYSPEAMVALWIAEKDHYKPGVFPNNSQTGNIRDVAHYTQVVWRKTLQVGCGRALGAREEIMVCRYSEPGNVMGRPPV